jgi:hypothetical protein
LADNILQTCGVHAVTHRGDETNVTGTQKSKVLVLAEILWVVLDGRKAQTSVHAVDAHNKLIDTGRNLCVVLKILFLRLDASGRGDLDENNLLTPLRVHLKEALESLQLLGNTSDTVQTVTSDNDLLSAVKLAQCVILGGHSIGPCVAFNLGSVDANGEDADLDTSSISINSESIGGKSKDSCAAAQKMARVTV